MGPRAAGRPHFTFARRCIAFSLEWGQSRVADIRTCISRASAKLIHRYARWLIVRLIWQGRPMIRNRRDHILNRIGPHETRPGENNISDL